MMSSCNQNIPNQNQAYNPFMPCNQADACGQRPACGQINPCDVERSAERRPRPACELPVMVEPAAQQNLGSLYSVNEALCRGTLFENLDKPMGGCDMTIPSCPVNPLQAIEFAVWELKLYLDTHPMDRNAQETLRDLKKQAEQLKACGCQAPEEPAVWTDGCHEPRKTPRKGFVWPWEMDDDA